MSSELKISVHDLLRRPGSRKEIDRQLTSEGYAISATGVPEGEPIEVQLVLESLANEGTIRVTGEVSTRFKGECRRCLGVVEDTLVAHVDELFSRSEDATTDEDVWPLESDEINITDVVRENIFLALPLSPLCKSECRGPVPDEYPALLADELPNDDEPEGDEAPGDPRWSALRALHFD
ncbi:MAG: DUF177 domain-containing protein [Acidimicrobiia bacterium]